MDSAVMFLLVMIRTRLFRHPVSGAAGLDSSSYSSSRERAAPGPAG